MKQLIKCLVLALFGGIVYYIIEILWRGHSYCSMAILGGLCFVLIGLINEFYTWDMSLISQMFISSVAITVFEFLAGLIVNLWLNIGVWDYTNTPYNFLGQICLLYSNLWFLLSLAGILLDDWLRYWIFKEDKPHYKLF